MKETLCTAGFARLDITPPLGTYIGGYFKERYTKGVLDPIYVRAIAFGEGKKSAVILVLDMCSLRNESANDWPVEIARRLGLKRKAMLWDKEADKLAGLMVKYLYDPDQNMFFDAYADSGKRQTLITSSAMLPLWCGVPLPEEKIQDMIRNWMLNPEKLYGDVPFPSVAYDQDCYEAGGWFVFLCYCLTIHTMDSTWLQRGKRSAAMADLTL